MVEEVKGGASEALRGDPSSARAVLQLLAFCLVMLVGSYCAGSIPLYMPLNEEKLQLVSVMGAGLLVGTALAVIIPEGMQALIKASQAHASSDHHHEGAAHDAFEGLDRSIGMALVLGFLFMLLVDQLASKASKSDLEANASTLAGRNVSWTTTLGLVVHAAADGIALGAASSTRHTDIEFIVFMAIMLHKAPAAFGLTSFLMREGLDKAKIRRHLLVFSISAPALAFFTYTWLGASGQGRRMDTMHATGLAMLFSAGTFLFVATVHVLPEIMSKGSNNGPSPGHSHSVGFGKIEIVMLVIGIALPLVLTMGHHH
ncbi:hypothetical protein TCAL_10434 [Tigriopus californicus]|uniref:Zinc transporter ZIP9 n=1 Tax=Tigriopus californicus TaxID=6832 RepID=A0A553PBY5_TIGCA|nr:zinc transporter ZIP9-like [Tigriopus californicus]TRY75193.1 hypothetical protein TCAL_10434 [Tigriopus californicus]|eukprot:TCALIF_10434-PA protein Name:"Similar to slc39a9-a Zinc transporter ZIP9-A (Xenopus laevis)" AED:0.02 eAED:0.02 QI:0/-1/0/1/-1/1/1/0/314